MGNNKFKYRDGLVFGIDLGIGSVGWAVLDQNGKKYIDKGVVKFEQAEKAEDRRNARGARRRLHRRKYRLERILNVLKENQFPSKNTTDSELLTKRIMGLKEKITLQDITNIIIYFTIHRGYIPFDFEVRESNLVIELKEKYEYPCLIQQELLNKNKKYRTTEHPILHSDYEKELIAILKEQSKYYNNITEDFIEKILNIINTKRKFWEGPGAPREDSLTPYGRYRNEYDLKEYEKNPKYRKYLFQDLIGNCKIYVGEKRASSYNYYAEMFNFYNSFVNLRFPKTEITVEKDNSKFFKYADGVNEDKKYKLTTDSILKIKQYIFEKDRVVLKSMFKELFNVEEFEGYKKDNEGKPDLCRFQITKEIKNKIENKELYNVLFDNIDLYNKVILMIQISPDENSRYEMIKDIIETSKIKELNNNQFIQNLSKLKIENKYHSFSEKALKIYLEYMLQTNENSSSVERIYEDEISPDVEDDIIDEYLMDIDEGKLQYINPKFIDDIVASPVVKKAIRKAEAVLNKLFSKYGYPEYISIETTRELLSPEKQIEYDKKTLGNALKRKNAAIKLEEDGYEASDVNIDKYLMLQETKWKCAYCNKDIKIENSEIEHILPISITGDDSYDNKTISCTECNHKKGNKSPYNYLKVDNRYDEFKVKIESNKEISYKKKEYLLFEWDLNKYEKRFKNRNLNETAHATNELAKQINLFKKAYEVSCGEALDTKVLRIPGQFTHLCRKKFKLEKNREQEYHHAVDAVIIANYANTRIGKLMDMIQNDKEKYWKIQNMQDYRDEKELFDNIFLNKELLQILKDANFENTRFSREVVKKLTGQLFDADVKKAILKDGKYYTIEQINNIYELSHEDVKKKIKNNKEILIKTGNPKLYKKLVDIIEKYDKVKGNQFVEYCKENIDIDWSKEKFNPYIHGIRVSNKSNADVVIKLRYLQINNNPFILNKKSVNKKNETINVCTSTTSYGTRVFSDGEKLYFLPMYRVFVNLKTGELLKDNEFYKLIYDAYVGKTNVNFVMDLFTNDYIRFEDKSGKIIEGYVSYFDKTNNILIIKKAGALKSNCRNLKKIQSDILGLYNLNI